MRYPVLAQMLVLLCLSTACAEVSSIAWPTDDELPGMMGCKFFRYRGWWEADEDTADPEEGTEAICITVAMASIMNFHRWPTESLFDGIYMDPGDGGIEPVYIAHKWHYGLITGSYGRNEKCYDDDPATRTLPGRPEWSGLNEIRKLIFVVERAFGRNDEALRVPGDGCEGVGYYSLHYILRNRLGYPNATSLTVKNPQCKRLVIQDLQRGLPVLGAKCEHTFVIDGYRVNKKTGKAQFHLADHVDGSATMGWFTWKQMLSEGVVQMVTGLSPDVLLTKGGQKEFGYYWGDGYVPHTSHNDRQVFLRVIRPSGSPLGTLGITLTAHHRDAGSATKPEVLYRANASSDDAVLRIPQRGTLPLSVGERTKLTLVLRNGDRYSKKVRIVLHDFESDHSVSVGDERYLFGN